jgi:hypothetical protein
MCFSGISGSEAHGDEVMVLVASLSTDLGDRGSERDLCVGWFSMLICSEVRRRRGSRGAGQGQSDRIVYQVASLVCVLISTDNLLRWLERGGNSYWFLAVFGKRGNGGFVWASRPGCTILLLGRHSKEAQRPAS